MENNENDIHSNYNNNNNYNNSNNNSSNDNINHDNNTEKVLILPLNADSKKITQTLSNETALKILELLAQQPMSATAISEELDLALTTIKYNLDALIESDLIKINKTKWSKKGRKIKIYEPVQKLIVVMPGGGKSDKTSIINMLKKYLSMIGAVIFASVGIEYLAKITGSGIGMQSMPKTATITTSDSIVEPIAESAQNVALMQINETIPESAHVTNAILNDTLREIEVALPVAPHDEMEMAVKSMEPVALDTINQGLASHIGLWFFFGCMFVILFLLIRELYNRKK